MEAIAGTNQPVLITGESGTGKELVAKTLHSLGRSREKMVTVNVAGLDDNIFSDTLFGHTQGAFTGADKRRMGMIETAGDGTLFLDEIGDLSMASQVKLLRLIQEGEYYPVGGDIPRHSRARIICSTHQNLLKKEKELTFRKDLYYRLHTHHINLPPLRERKDDIPLLLDYFIRYSCKATGKKIPFYPKELATLLAAYHFPGNIRQLKSMVYDAVATHRTGTLSMNTFEKIIHAGQEKDLLPETGGSGETDTINPFSGIEVLPTFQEASDLLMAEALRRTNGNQSMAARFLGVSQPALSKRLKVSKNSHS
jgi:DNA-binding NtrC family response regulator